ncbi:M14 family zinc carboxypeptidase [Candidatus Latescibacterota bacterium]
MRKQIIFLSLISLVLIMSGCAKENLAIDADYPGGNILVERIDGDTVFLKQDLRDTEGWWFYWNFRVRGAAGRTLTFNMDSGRNPTGALSPICSRGPAVSTDGGETWSWLGLESENSASFSFTFPDDNQETRFCLAMPYQEANLHNFLETHTSNPSLSVEELCKTRKNRSVEMIRVGKIEGNTKHRMLLTCRHHSCEMMASYSLEGIIETVLSDSEDGVWFRENVEVLAVPFMDKDGVEDGDQGKNRKPYDHNRDYEGTSIYPSVAALRELVPEWSGGKLHFAMDMHSPYVGGGVDELGGPEQIFFVGGASEKNWENVYEFTTILEETQRGPLKYSTKHNMPWGVGWNTIEGKSSNGKWTETLPGILVGSSLELPYGNAGGNAVTAESARAFGRDLARAARLYLEKYTDR